MSTINDGTGTGNVARVSGNRMFTHSVTETEPLHATEVGDAYNINTGTIGLTSTTASDVLYIKNNEARDLVIESLTIGIGSAGTTTDVSSITIVRNPVSVDFSTAVDMNQNRNFGSSRTIAVDAYKGVEGSTHTNGDDIALAYAAPGTRVAIPVNFILTKGDRIAVNIDTNTTSGTTNVYVVAVCFLKEVDFTE